jgi:hypothetical protein
MTNQPQQVTTRQFDFDKVTNTFTSNSNRLFLKGNQGEYFAFFLMRGKKTDYQFAYTHTENKDGKVFDCYISTKDPFYTCRIERKD